MSGPDAVRAVRLLGTIRSLADGLLGKMAKRVDDTAAHAHTQDRDAVHLCARVTGTTASEVQRAIATAARLEELPTTDAAVRAGRLSARQAKMIADAARRNPAAEPELLAAAAAGMVPLQDACVAARAAIEDPDARARYQHAARSLRIWTAADGMVEGRFRLAPLPGAALRAALDACSQRIFRARHAARDREPHDAYAADALCTLVDRGARGASRRPVGTPTRIGVGTTVHVVIDHAALVRGRALPGERCEIPGVGPVSRSLVTELLGDAFVTAIVQKGKDITTVAHLGRHIPAELRTALTVSGRECDVAGCHARAYLELDHSEVDHARGGPAAWWNLTWLCYLHHKRKSGGQTLGPRDPHTRKRTLGPRPRAPAVRV